jgi:UPF0176 protein
VLVVALYKFFSFLDVEAKRAPLEALLMESSILGTLILAREGINGTLSGEDEPLRRMVSEIERITGSGTLECKFSSGLRPFRELKVRVRPEIVTLGIAEVDPTARVGTYVEPEDWNALIADPEVILVDTRNSYEVRVGTFENARDPNTLTFREFTQYAERALDPQKHRKVAMFCTGGIRCEKASSLLLEKGFEQVYHLKGGILKYLEKVPEAASKFQGDCFVFDERVAVAHGLTPADYVNCHGCGDPLSTQDREADYVPGKHCRFCVARNGPDAPKTKPAKRRKRKLKA